MLAVGHIPPTLFPASASASNLLLLECELRALRAGAAFSTPSKQVCVVVTVGHIPPTLFPAAVCVCVWLSMCGHSVSHNVWLSVCVVVTIRRIPPTLFSTAAATHNQDFSFQSRCKSPCVCQPQHRGKTSNETEQRKMMGVVEQAPSCRKVGRRHGQG